MHTTTTTTNPERNHNLDALAWDEPTLSSGHTLPEVREERPSWMQVVMSALRVWFQTSTPVPVEDLSTERSRDLLWTLQALEARAAN